MMAETGNITVSATKRSPSDFLKQVLGRPVVVKLHSGVEYRGQKRLIIYGFKITRL